MNYIKLIEATSNWTCPKSSTYLVICVGGGGGGISGTGNNHTGRAGQLAVETVTLPANAIVPCTIGNGGNAGNDSAAATDGGSTLFGAYLSASGGSRRYDSMNGGGEGGYTLDGTYGGNGGYRASGNAGGATKNGGAPGSPGLGYGAGGSQYSGGSKGVIVIKDIGEGYMKCLTASTTWTSPKSAVYRILCVGGGGGGVSSPLSFGRAGALKVTTVSLTANAQVNCTIGAGGGTGETGGSSSFGSYLTSPGGESIGATFTGGEGGYTLDGVYGGSGGDYISTGTVILTASAAKNGGRQSYAGSGYGAGGSYGEPAGKDGIIIITEVG